MSDERARAFRVGLDWLASTLDDMGVETITIEMCCESGVATYEVATVSATSGAGHPNIGAALDALDEASRR